MNTETQMGTGSNSREDGFSRESEPTQLSRTPSDEPATNSLKLSPAKENAAADLRRRVDRNTGHGHVFPRPDGVRARCGGPGICLDCSRDLARKNAQENGEHPKSEAVTSNPNIPDWCSERYGFVTVPKDGSRDFRKLSDGAWCSWVEAQAKIEQLARERDEARATVQLTESITARMERLARSRIEEERDRLRHERNAAHRKADRLRAALMPSDGGTASFPDEIEVVAEIVDRYDAGSGLGVHLRTRAAAIREALNGEPATTSYQMTASEESSFSKAFARKRVADETSAPLYQMSPAAADVIAERLRQLTKEGWSPEHDDQHSDGQLAEAAACYALSGAGNLRSTFERWWPWSFAWWKPKGERRDLVRAGALILAEIERLDRASKKASGEPHAD